MSTIFDPVDLLQLPPPKVIETPDFEVLLHDTLVQFQSLLPEYSLLLESDPVVKVIEAFIYREMGLRERINYVAKTRLLAFATESDLDQLAAFYSVTRLVLTPATSTTAAVVEADEAFRTRIQQRILGWSNAGPAAHYSYFAMAADARVREVSVYSPDFSGAIKLGGKVEIAVLSKIGNLVPTPDLLQAVSAEVSRNDVRMLTDLVEVVPAQPVTVNVSARITLQRGTTPTRVAELQLILADKFAEIQSLGRDITRSWLASALQASGVHGVEILQPVANVIIPPNYFPSLGSVTLEFYGYGDSEGYGVGESDSQRALRGVNQHYVDYAVANKLSHDQIVADLAEAPRPGVIQPTVRGIAAYLNITNVYETDGVTFLPEDQIAYLIWYDLNTKRYNL